MMKQVAVETIISDVNQRMAHFIMELADKHGVDNSVILLILTGSAARVMTLSYDVEIVEETCALGINEGIELKKQRFN